MHPTRTAKIAETKASYLIDRIEAQILFARALCEFQPRKAAAWKKLIDKATSKVDEAASRGGLRGIAEAVVTAEEIMRPLAESAKAHTIYCIGHAHIDMNWQWSWQETVATTGDTFATMLQLMKEDPSFCFSQSQASVYKIVEDHFPEMLEAISKRVKEGRWEVTASHWVEGDKNLAGGESLCRHLLYTRRYMKDLLGLSPEAINIDWAPDTFGHAHTVPTYLTRGGVRYVYMHRPGALGPKRPQAFWWKGPDGSRVLVRNDMHAGYNGVIKAKRLVNHLVGFKRESGLPFVKYVYGVGDHGGGPTRRDIARIADFDTWPIFPKVCCSTSRTFFDRLETEGSKLPTLDCELNFEFAGCYTSQSLIKRDNRVGENRMGDAETFAALKWAVARGAYNAGAFEDGWRDVLFSHFHDILPGSGVHDTRAYTHGLFQKVMAMTGAEEAKALRHLASCIDTSRFNAETIGNLHSIHMMDGLGAGVGYASVDGMASMAEQGAGRGERPFVIFNPCSWDREEIVDAVIWDRCLDETADDFKRTNFAVRTPDGKTLPGQVVDKGGYWGHEFVKVAFPAHVGSLGHSVSAVTEQLSDARPPSLPAELEASKARQVGKDHHCAYSIHERCAEGLENDLIRFDLDTESGGIRALIDKQSETALIAEQPGASILEYAVEHGQGMTSWRIYPTGPVEKPKVTGIARKLRGPYKASLEVKLQIHQSRFTLTYELRAGDPRLHINLKGTWLEHGSREKGIPQLRMAFPFALSEARARYEIPFGAIDRDLNQDEEVPALQWAQVSGRSAGRDVGCLLLNDSKYGHALQGSTLRLTLIRGSYDPDPLPEIGEHEINAALLPFSDEMPVAEAIRHGNDFNHALRVVGTGVHKGTLPEEAALIESSPNSVVLSAVKKAEKGDALILRLFNPTARRVQAKVRLDRDLAGKARKAVEVDLMERPLKQSTSKLEGNTVTLALPSRGIASVMVALERKRARR